MVSILGKNDAEIIETFIIAPRYLNDLLNMDTVYFG